MVGEYHRGRWAGMFEQLRSGKPFSTLAWEEQWITTPGRNVQRPEPIDAVGAGSQLMEKADRFDQAR